MENSFITPNQEMRRKYLPCPSTRKDLSYESYAQLLKEHGLEINSKCFPSYFKLRNGLEYPGVATDSTMSSNEVLVKVPKNLVLSSFTATQRPQLQQIFKERFYHEQYTWQDRVLNTYLLYIYGQKQTSNVWYHLVEHLPKEIDIIGFWPEEDLDKFKDLTVKCAAENNKDSFEEEWAAFSQIKDKHQILQNEVFSKQNYRWIFIHLTSRCFGKQLQFTSMVPFCQLFNHHAVGGHYEVQTLQKEEQQTTNQNQDASSVTTDGSYLSEDYMQVGEYDYDEIQCQPIVQQCKDQIDLDEKEKNSILEQSKNILKIMEEKLNWQDSTILFIPHLIQRSKMIETQYKAGRKPYQRASGELKLVQDSVLLFIDLITQTYKQWKGKYYVYKCEQVKKKQQEKKKQEDILKPDEQGLIQFPTEQKRKYDNFLLLTGKRDHYELNNQVYFCYGRNSNRTLLLRYGFAIQGNKYEHMWLSFDIGNTLVYFPDTLQMLEEKHLSLRRKFKIKINRLNMELILFFRLNSWSFYGKNSVQDLFKVKNYDQQIAIMIQLEESLQFRLQHFQGTYDLTDPNLSYHDYFINVYHQQKQKILQQHVNFIKSIISFLKALESGIDINKAKQQFTAHEKFIFRHYLAQF